MKAESQRFTGKGQLINRLASQVGSYKLAVGILQKRGDLKSDGKTFTDKGAKRNSMTASERAIARADKVSKHSSSDYKYNKLTNRATLKNK